MRYIIDTNAFKVIVNFISLAFTLRYSIYIGIISKIQISLKVLL